MNVDIQKIREDFPILSRTVYGKPLVYFDNGATTQKPRLVVDALVDEYYSVNANVHRGVHYLSQQATELHEASRETVRQFINARSTSEVVFTRIRVDPRFAPAGTVTVPLCWPKPFASNTSSEAENTPF